MEIMTLNLLLNQLETNLSRFTQTYAAVQICCSQISQKVYHQNN